MRGPPRETRVPWRDAMSSAIDEEDEEDDVVGTLPRRAADDVGTAESQPLPAMSVSNTTGTTRFPQRPRRWRGRNGRRKAALRGLLSSARCWGRWLATAAAPS